MRAILLITICSILLPCSAAADIYSFIDESGVAHFSNAPGNSRYSLLISTRAGRRSTGRRSTAGRYDDFIYIASKRHRVNPMLIKAVIKVESNFNRLAVSEKGARGLMQLMPEVAREMNVSSPYDPNQNIQAGTRYLRKMLDLFDDDLSLALAAYNAGPARVKAAGGIPKFKETRNFVKKVRSHYMQYRAAGR